MNAIPKLLSINYLLQFDMPLKSIDQSIKQSNTIFKITFKSDVNVIEYYQYWKRMHKVI